MLSDLSAVRAELRIAIANMDVVTRKKQADRYQLSSRRMRLSQAGLKGCNAWNAIMKDLPQRVDRDAAESLRSLHQDHLEVLRHSSTHIGKWTLDRIEEDWSGYCAAYKTLRGILLGYIESEDWTVESVLSGGR